MPKRGTLLFCSSSSQVPSRLEPTEHYTMFSGALRAALYRGSSDPAAKSSFSFSDIRHLVCENLEKKFGDRAVYPQLTTHDQTESDLRDVPVFHNPAKYGRSPERHESVRTTAGQSRYAQNLILSFLISLMSIWTLAFLPFLAGAVFQSYYGNSTLLTSFGITLSGALIATIFMAFIRKLLGLSQLESFLIAGGFAIGGAIFSAINYLILADLIGAITSKSEFLSYSSDLELRFVGGVFLVAFILQSYKKTDFPISTIATTTIGIIYLRYLLFSVALSTSSLSGSVLADLVFSLFAFPSLLTGILFATSKGRRWGWKEFFVVLVPSLLTPLRTFSPTTDLFLWFDLKNSIVVDFMHLYFFWLFAIPTAWTLPALLLCRPRLVLGLLRTPRAW